MGVTTEALLDVQKLNAIYTKASKSMRQRIQCDFDYVSNLGDVLDIELDVPDYKVNLQDPNIFFRQINAYLYPMEELAEYVIEMFKCIDFYWYQRMCYRSLKDGEFSSLLKDFLEYFFKDLIDIYNYLVEHDHVFSVDLRGVSGESFLFNQIESYYIALCDSASDIYMMETIVHELMHIYANMFLCNYRSAGLANLQNGFFGETLSLYAEVSLYEFLRKRGVCGDELLLGRNWSDYAILDYFKTVNYVAKIANREEITLETDNVDYTVMGKNKLRLDVGVPFFCYSDSFSKGKLLNFRYAMSSIDAFSFLKREKEGDNIKKMINDYLIKFQSDSMMDEFLSEFHDLTFMHQEINNRVQELKLKYPVPGYEVK